VRVINAGLNKRFRQIFLVEMRQAARARKPPHIGEQLNLLASEQFKELFEGAV